MKNILGDIITGWTTYVLHPVLFYPNLGQWFSPGTSASSTTKTGRHDITEILLKVALSTSKKTYANKSTYKQSVGRSLSINQFD
jgi:hypothetical protein